MRVPGSTAARNVAAVLVKDHDQDFAKQSIPRLTVQSDVIERVTTFKLLGVTPSNDLSWEAHVNSICAKIAPRLYYLKQLRRAGLSSDELSHFYLTVIRPVLEYGCAV